MVSGLSTTFIIITTPTPVAPAPEASSHHLHSQWPVLICPTTRPPTAPTRQQPLLSRTPIRLEATAGEVEPVEEEEAEVIPLLQQPLPVES